MDLGVPPGTLVVDPSWPKPFIRVFAYGPDQLEERRDVKVADLAGLVGEWPVVWVNVDGLGDADTIKAIGDIFGLHRLALEDSLDIRQRAKVEQYDNHLFIVARMITMDTTLETEQISMFVGKGFLVTFQEHVGDCLELVRDRIRKAGGRIRRSGSDYLAYSLLDAVVDAYYPVLEAFGDRMEDMESSVIQHPDSLTMVGIRSLKRDLLTFRREVWPIREAVNSLLREAVPFLQHETQIYLRDCYDHAIQVIDMIETHREMSSGLTDVYMSSISNRTNEIMKVLTIFSAIFIPLTFIAGLYGMNFNTAHPLNMPELNEPWGYPAVLGAMLTLAIGMLFYFKHKGWIWRKK